MPFKTPGPIIDKVKENVFDGDYRRSWGDADAIKKIHELMRANPTYQEKDIKTKYPEADDDLIRDALDQVEVVDTFAGVPAPKKYYYRGIRYAPNEEEEQNIKDETFYKVHSKLPF